MPHQANIDRFSGFADCYDSARPTPPATVMNILNQYLQGHRPDMVVDLGCGTGLSTRAWAGHANKVIGIEPNNDMRQQAIHATRSDHISYQAGNSSNTGLPDSSVDIITCSQALHWMEPEPTFKEAQRILKTGGIFASIDCDWPPIMNWQIEAAYLEFDAKVDELAIKHGITQRIQLWPKEKHLYNMQKSGVFRFTREALVHSQEQGNDHRLIMLARSMGSVASLLKSGLSEDEIGLTALQKAAAQYLSSTLQPWFFSYRIRIGIR